VRSVVVLRNVVTNYLRYLLAGAIGFLLTPVLVHGLGDAGYGLWVTVFSLTGYFGLFDQGIRPSLVRYVSRDHALGDREGVARTLNSALALYGALGVVTLGITVVAATALTGLLHVAPGQAAEARQVILLAGLSIALGFPLGVFGAALSGLQRYDLANLVGMVVGVVRALAFVAVLRLGGGLVGLAWASLAMNLAGHAVSALLVTRLLPGLHLTVGGVTRQRLVLIGTYSGFAFVGALANSVTFQTDALVISAFLGAASVTPFALAAGLVDTVRQLVYSAAWVLAPTASDLDARGETGTLHAMVIAGAKYSVLVSWPVLFGLLVFGPDLLATWIGPRYVAEPLLRTLAHPALWRASVSAAPLLVWLVLPTFVSLPQSAASSVLYGVSRHRGVVALALVNAAANLGLSILWARPFGLAGVALGTAIPLLLVGGIATAAYTAHALRLPLGRYAWQGFARPGLVTLTFLGPAVAVRALHAPSGWWQLAAATGGPWLLFLAVAWTVGLDADERRRWGRMVPGLFGARPAGGGAGR
jgi:O-antigen/teichoic acid export membrane protein